MLFQQPPLGILEWCIALSHGPNCFSRLSTLLSLTVTVDSTFCMHCIISLKHYFLLYSLQTGSGKTYTMGTGFDMALDADEVGVIPRAVNQIFTGIEERRREAIERNEPPPQYELTAQFLEVCSQCA